MFKSQNFCHIASNNRNNVKAGMFIYRTTDDLATVTANGYFNDRIIDLNLHDIIVHEQIDNADPTKVKQNFLCVVQKTLTNVNTKIMDTDEVDGANTDLDNLSDTGKANISAEGTYDSNATYDAGTVGEAITGKASTDLSNLTATGANIANWSTNVSNCITEIPQDIKLELNNGTLTLKAGSKVYVPNDVGVFDEVVITNDITPQAFSVNDDVYGVYVNTSQQLFCKKLSGFVSGATTPPAISDGIWYNTTANRIEWYTDSAWSGNGGRSFPIAIITVSNGAISSIDQVFNGFGYIGSTVFALPGVKGLIPDGRNADGTLKTVKVSVSNLDTMTHSSGTVYNDYAVLGLKSDGTIDIFSPSVYNPETNYVNSHNYTQHIQVGRVMVELSGTISYFGDIKQPFHAVDYNDFAKLETSKANTSLDNVSAGIDFVVESQLPTAQNNYTWYRKYKSGWVEQGGYVATSSDVEKTVSLPVQMDNVYYDVQIQREYASSPGSTNANLTAMCVWGLSTTGFKCWDKYGTSIGVHWEVKGKAA